MFLLYKEIVDLKMTLPERLRDMTQEAIDTLMRSNQDE